MKYNVNEACVGCGMCCNICPNVFAMNDAGLAQAIDADIEPQDADASENAMNCCPVGAIEQE